MLELLVPNANVGVDPFADTRDINSRKWPKTLLLHPLPQTLFSSPSSDP